MWSAKGCIALTELYKRWAFSMNTEKVLPFLNVPKLVQSKQYLHIHADVIYPNLAKVEV